MVAQMLGSQITEALRSCAFGQVIVICLALGQSIRRTVQSKGYVANFLSSVFFYDDCDYTLSFSEETGGWSLERRPFNSLQPGEAVLSVQMTPEVCKLPEESSSCA